MPVRLPVRRTPAESKELLRSDTAHVMAAATAGVVKLVAASMGFGSSRLYKMTEAEEANTLELLCRCLDRLDQERLHDRTVAVLRWLVARYGYGLQQLAESGSDVLELAAAAAAREGAEATASVLEAIADGDVSELEAARVLREAREARERAGALEAVAQAVLDRKKRQVRTVPA